MGRNRGIYVAALVLAFVFFLCYSAWFSEFLLALLLCLPVLSLLVSLPAMLTARPVISWPGEVTRGDPAEVRVQLHCAMPAPESGLTLALEDGMTGREAKYRWDMGKRTTLPLSSLHCGSIRCSVRRFWVCDYLGLFRIRRCWQDTGQLLVLPVPRLPDPLPNVERLHVHDYRPLPGGGFSEVHELRDYQPGDSLRDFNWKLTAKMDKPIVREPQIADQRAVVLSADLTGKPEELDRTLDCLVGASAWLAGQGVAHAVRWFSGSQSQSFSVAGPQDVHRLTLALCASERGAEHVSAASLAGDARWHYHVSPDAGGNP